MAATTGTGNRPAWRASLRLLPLATGSEKGGGVAVRPVQILLQTTTSAGGAQPAQQAPLSWAQIAVVVLLAITIAAIVAMLVWAGVGRKALARDERSWLDYGNFYVVVFGVAAVVIGFLVMLLFLDRFADEIQALGFLTALFGAIAGLVGTYFGVKSSADAREGAEKVALATGLGSTSPVIALAPAEATLNQGSDHTVFATVIRVDGSLAAGVPVAFAVTSGPDTNASSTEITDTSGQARFTFTNGNTAGTDTIEAVSLKGKGSATVTFT